MSSNHKFSFSFSMFLAGRSWASLGVRGHPLGPLGAILGFVGLFLGPSRGQLGALLGSLGVHGHPLDSLGATLGIPGLLLGPSRCHLHPCWPLLESSLAILGACLRPSWASYGAGWAALESSLGGPGPLAPPGSWGSCVVEEWRHTYNCFNIDGAEHRRLK